MPFVHVMMEPRDDETRHRITREVSDVMAEATGNSLDGMNIIFHELPRASYGRGLALASRRPPDARGQHALGQVPDQRDHPRPPSRGADHVGGTGVARPRAGRIHPLAPPDQQGGRERSDEVRGGHHGGRHPGRG